MGLEIITLIIASCLFSNAIANQPLFVCTFDDGSFENMCGGIRVNVTSEDLFLIASPASSIKPTSLSQPIIVTDITSIESPTLIGSTCSIPFNLNNEEQYFCVDDKCLDDDGVESECNIGKFVRLTSSGDQLEVATIEFGNTISLDKGSEYIFNFRSIFGCTKLADGSNCKNSTDSEITIYMNEIQTGESIKIGNLYGRDDDFKWTEEIIKFRGNGEYRVSMELVISTGFILIDHLIIRMIPNEVSYECNFDQEIESTCLGSLLTTSNDSVIVLLSETGSVKLDETTIVKVTDVTSIEGNTLNNKKCKIPYNFQGEDQYFCYEDDLSGSFNCETQTGGIDECRLGKFVQLISNSDTDEIISAKLAPMFKENFYRISFRAIFGSASNNSIQVRFLSLNNKYKLIGSVLGTNVDSKWIEYEFFFDNKEEGNLEIDFKMQKGYIYFDRLVIECFDCALPEPTQVIITTTKNDHSIFTSEGLFKTTTEAETTSEATTERVSTTKPDIKTTQITHGITTTEAKITSEATTERVSTTKPDIKTTQITHGITTTEQKSTTKVNTNAITTTLQEISSKSTTEITTSTVEELITSNVLLDSFSCSFDDSLSLSDQCGGIRFEFQGQDIFHGIFKRSSIKLGLKVILVTDATSIEKPTSTGLSCQIPFSLYNLQNYFCVENSDDNLDEICLDKSNNTGVCKLGNFLNVGSNGVSRNSFSFEFKSMLDKDQNYALTMKTIYGCSESVGINCSSNENTKIKILIKNEIDVNFEDIKTLSGRNGDFKWIQDKIQLPVMSIRSVYVIKIEVSIITGYVLIDDLMVQIEGDEPTTTIVQTEAPVSTTQIMNATTTKDETNSVTSSTRSTETSTNEQSTTDPLIASSMTTLAITTTKPSTTTMTSEKTTTTTTRSSTTTTTSPTTTTTSPTTTTTTTSTSTKVEVTKPETTKTPSNSQQTAIIAGTVSGATVILAIGIFIVAYSVIKNKKKVNVIDDEAVRTNETNF